MAAGNHQQHNWLQAQPSQQQRRQRQWRGAEAHTRGTHETRTAQSWPYASTSGFCTKASTSAIWPRIVSVTAARGQEGAQVTSAANSPRQKVCIHSVQVPRLLASIAAARRLARGKPADRCLQASAQAQAAAAATSALKLTRRAHQHRSPKLADCCQCQRLFHCNRSSASAQRVTKVKRAWSIRTAPQRRGSRWAQQPRRQWVHRPHPPARGSPLTAERSCADGCAKAAQKQKRGG